MALSRCDHAVAGTHSWSPAPREISLGDNDIHIWCASLDDCREQRWRLEAVLSDDERERASTFHFAEDRDRFIASRGILRELLARYLHQPAAAITFSKGRFGKPEIADRGRSSRVHFNASHSGTLAIYAVTSACPVGIDIERVRDISDFDAVALRHFAPLEFRLLLAAPPDRRREAFLGYWTRTEAFLKATGAGLGGERRAAPSSDWHLHTLWPAAGYVAAVAYTHDAAQLSLWTFTEEALCRSQS